MTRNLLIFDSISFCSLIFLFAFKAKTLLIKIKFKSLFEILLLKERISI